MTTRPATTTGQYHQRLADEIARETGYADATATLIERLLRAVQADIAEHGPLTENEKTVLRANVKQMRGAVSGHRERADNARASLERISVSRHNSKLATPIQYPSAGAVDVTASGRVRAVVSAGFSGDPGFVGLAQAASEEMENPSWLEDINVR